MTDSIYKQQYTVFCKCIGPAPEEQTKPAIVSHWLLLADNSNGKVQHYNDYTQKPFPSQYPKIHAYADFSQSTLKINSGFIFKFVQQWRTCCNQASHTLSFQINRLFKTLILNLTTITQRTNYRMCSCSQYFYITDRIGKLEKKY